MGTLHTSHLKEVAGRIVLSRASFYFASGLLRRAASMLALPVLLVYLTPEEFSRYGLMLSALGLLVPLLSANAHLAPARLFFDQESKRGRADLMVSTLATATLLSAAGVGILLAALELMPLEDPVSRGALSIRILMGAALLGMVIMEYGSVSMKIAGDARVFALTETLHGFSLLALFVVLLGLSSDSIRALAAAHSLAAVVPAAVALHHARNHLTRGSFERSAALGALRFSTPTVLHVVAFWAISSGGRWIGAAHMPLETLATYMILTFAIGIVGMLSRALFEARLPEIGESFARGRYRLGTRIINGVSVFGGALTLILYGAAALLLPFLETTLPAPYRPTPLLLALAAAASLLDLSYSRALQLLLALKRPAAMAASTVVAAVGTLALALWLVRILRTPGLLLATVIGYALLAASASFVASRLLRRAERGTPADLPSTGPGR